MSPIYKEARHCYKNQEFVEIRIDRYEDGSVAAYSKDGRFLQIFSSRLVAEIEIEKQSAKARKFIQ